MKCIDCPSIWCKVFSEIWTGYCPQLRLMINGNDLCRVVKYSETIKIEDYEKGLLESL